MMRQELEAMLRQHETEHPGRIKWERSWNHHKQRDEYLISSQQSDGAVLGFIHIHTKHCTQDNIDRLDAIIRELIHGKLRDSKQA
jgi:hypothetical protein